MYQKLEKPARDALNKAKEGYDPREYRFGNLVPTYGMAQDPLGSRCLKSFELYRGLNCRGSNLEDKGQWAKYTNLLNYASSGQDVCV